MCTASWFYEADEGYQLFFNRDEQKTRSIAIEPKVFNDSSVKAIYPIDPDGNGTWISCNEYGISICLLNYYQGTPTLANQAKSRGLLVKQLSVFKQLKAIKDYFNTNTFSAYNPFSVLVFSLNSKKPYAVNWTGKELIETEINSPAISSSVDFENIYAQRLQTYREIVETPLSNSHSVDTAHEQKALSNKRITQKNYQQEIHLAFQKSHLPKKSKASVCMHREDAHTVSFSHIQVSSKEVIFNYVNSSPCGKATVSQTRISTR